MFSILISFCRPLCWNFYCTKLISQAFKLLYRTSWKIIFRIWCGRNIGVVVGSFGPWLHTFVVLDFYKTVQSLYIALGWSVSSCLEKGSLGLSRLTLFFYHFRNYYIALWRGQYFILNWTLQNLNLNFWYI